MEARVRTKVRKEMEKGSMGKVKVRKEMEKGDERLNTERTIKFMKETQVNLTTINQRNELAIFGLNKEKFRA